VGEPGVRCVNASGGLSVTAASGIFSRILDFGGRVVWRVLASKVRGSRHVAVSLKYASNIAA